MIELAPAERWFASKGWTPLRFQREVWSAFLRGESGLVHAATGTGKTLAAWWGPVLEWLAEHGDPSASSTDGRRPRVKRAAAPPLRVLWITPLRALAADTLESLSDPLRDLGIPWTLESRTGDTKPGARARQSKRLPTALVTTPESFTLILTRPDARELFTELRAVVVDEWHELMGTKRGVQAELALARIRTLAPTARIWGLSATIGNLGEARDALLSVGPSAKRGPIVRGVERKAVVVDALIPPVIERFPWAGHLGTTMVPQVVAAIEEAESTIVFTNTRSQTEIWYQGILAAKPEWAGSIALHHGSLDRKTRDWVENAMRKGALRCVVATSSLDLGVDFSPVDRVLQIGSPKGVARLLQRAGRSGHRPGEVSRVTCVPTNALELLEVAAVRDGMESGAIEARLQVERPLDVLAQHLVTVALGGGFEASELLTEVRSTRAYAGLTDEEWEWALEFVASGGESLRSYPEYARVERENGRYVLTDREQARRHRMSIGTIVSDAQIVVQYLRGGVLGSVEETFVARLTPGMRFFFAGTPLEFVRVREMRVWVRRAPNTRGAIPRWMGSRLPLSDELAHLLRRRLGEAADGVYRGAELEALRPLLEIQQKWSEIPHEDELLVERVHSRDGWHLFLYPLEGRLVHEGLAALFAYRMARLAPLSFAMSSNDWGIELLTPDEPPLNEALAAGLLSGDDLIDDLPASLNAAEMAKRQFREIARVAGLVFPGLPRSGKTARQLQASSGLFFDVFQRYDPGNLLLAQAHREVLERQLERSRLGATLRRLSRARVVVTSPKRFTPLSFPLLVDRTRNKVSSEKLSDRIKRMQLALERAAG
ncbi:MAG TPA: ligase-associated DNA damage response DEXH box helicase [Gemmatimonadaceae bacterium]|nr:ligase-associated DNA damage response DEXH box helicase [Gemmatimonadaceae bacterium]